TPKAFALVVDALLRKQDYRAAMALLVNWVGQAEQVPLEEGPHSFHHLSLRWLLGVVFPPSPPLRGRGEQGPPLPRSRGEGGLTLAQKFFDYLEANAEDYWQVPVVSFEDSEQQAKEESENLFEAAYEDVTYRDSTGNDDEGSVVGSRPRAEFDLEQ